MLKRHMRTSCPFLAGIPAEVFDVPGDMHRKGRPVDHEFPDSEILYRRIPADLPRWGMKVPFYALPLPDVSVNRSEHGGKAEYVLYDVVNQKHLARHGVVAFTAGHLVQPTGLQPGRRIQVKLSHEPLELNYFHAEIQAHDEQRGHLKSMDEEDENWIALWRNLCRGPVNTSDVRSLSVSAVVAHTRPSRYLSANSSRAGVRSPLALIRRGAWSKTMRKPRS